MKKILFIIMFSSISLSASAKNKPQATQPIITIWVHGTKPQAFLPKHLSMFTKKMERTLYGCKPGLHKAADLDLQYYQYSLAKELSNVAPEQFQWEHFYIYGWSGKLDPQDRKIAAYELFCALQGLVDDYEKKYGCEPKIVVITHSHGGSVALHMADPEIHSDTPVSVNQKTPFTIDKLILLACPVQHYTQALVKSTMFKRIYSIHSHTDMIQVLDPQGLHPFFKMEKAANIKAAFQKSVFCKKNGPLFSRRHFCVHPKIPQANIRWQHGIPWPATQDALDAVHFKPVKTALKNLDKLKKNRGLLHIEFQLLPFIRLLPKVIQYLDTQMQNYTHCISNADPDVMIQL